MHYLSYELHILVELDSIATEMLAFLSKSSTNKNDNDPMIAIP